MRRRIALALVVGLIVTAAINHGFQNQRTADGNAQDGSQVVTLTEVLSDGRLETTLTPSGNLTYLIDVRLNAPPDVLAQTDLKPDANFAMTDMHMDGIVPLFSRVGRGVWQARLVLPMAGDWVMNVGFGEDFSETVFSAR